MLVTKSKLTKNDAVVEYFRETLSIPLQRNIMSLSTPPTDLNGWYKWAIKLQNNFLRMKSAISKTQNRGGNTTSNTNKKTNEKGPWRFYFDCWRWILKENPPTSCNDSFGIIVAWVKCERKPPTCRHDMLGLKEAWQYVETIIIHNSDKNKKIRKKKVPVSVSIVAGGGAGGAPHPYPHP